MTDRLGTIGQQYSDDPGNPLIDGKLFIYDSGTLAPKDTFADINLTILNTNPVLLDGAGRQPNVWFEGFAKIILTSSDDVQIEERDPIGSSTGGAFSSWTASVIYGANEIVTGSNGNFYRSLSAGNNGNDPTTDTSSWTRVQFTETWNTNDTYTIDDIVQGSDGALYVAITSSNTGNDPVGDTVNWSVVGAEPDIVLLSTVTLSTDTFVDFTLTPGYTSYIVKLLNVLGIAFANKRIRTSTDGGSSFDVAASDYRYIQSLTADNSATITSFRSVASTGILFSGSGDEINATITIYKPSDAQFCQFGIESSWNDAGVIKASTGSGARVATADVDAIRFDAAAGTLDTGIIKLYGVI